MRMIWRTFLPPLLLAPLATSHFLINYPESIGFSDDDQSEYPCGGFEVTTRDSVTDFPISGIPISLTTTHPQDTWFFRAALLNDTENWVSLSPAIQQTGRGDFCSTNVKGLAQWEGQDAVLQVVTNAPDGFLFGCAAIRFVSGAATPPGSDCKNGPQVESESSDAEIILNASVTSTVVAGPQVTGSRTTSAANGDDDHAGHSMTVTETGSSSTEAATTTTAPESTGTPNAAARYRNGVVGALGGAVGIVGWFLI
ncbi:hypothetical protein TWF718_007774 [Orbilia javanica]|uniref:Copper acquisition factor BIM1-like domain-containing protein n=1 Tax=Orbilia javanica TaxID=47235 RepID=A0AAN8RMI3_9PEZI